MHLIHSTLHSYSQVFFSKHKGLAILLLLATLLDPQTGLFGLAAVLLSNALARLLGFAPQTIDEGGYGFNALLLGLALGKQFLLNTPLLVFFFVSIFLLLMMTVALSGWLGARGLPVLSLPFVFSFWLVALAARQFQGLQFNDTDIFYLNTHALYQASTWYQWAHSLDAWQLPDFWAIYLRTLASTFFQNSVLAGVLVAIGLLWWSRIAFTLSLLGLATAFAFYQLLGADTLALTYFLVGSNYIFLAVAVGGFFCVPSAASYVAAMVLTPILLFLLLAANQVLSVFQLPGFTLAFSVVVIWMIWVLKHRWIQRGLQLVTIQYYSAEKAIYQHVHAQKRYANAHLAQIYLPFWGEWQVSQGYDGKITHLGDWGKALDFVILDTEGKTYQVPGTETTDFYCYDKPVLAPADGYVYAIINTVEDNEIAEVDTEQNWGNTLIINHNNGLFTQLSHLKKDSFQVEIGDYVKRGTLLATCGSSGRSPEPHLHVQLQYSPVVGAPTVAYPLAYYIERQGNRRLLQIANVPQERALVSNVEPNALLVAAFGWLPNQRIDIQSKSAPYRQQTHWTTHTDAYNRSYLYCPATRSVAYYVNDGTMFYFTDFEGDRRSVLFQFYLAAYRVLLGYYDDLEVSDQLPLHHFNHWALAWIQDFFAPFYRFTAAHYQLHYQSIDSDFAPTSIELQSSVLVKGWGRKLRQSAFQLVVSHQQIELNGEWTIRRGS